MRSSIHHARRFDPRIESGKKNGPPTSDGKSRAGNAIRIDFRTGLQVIHGANIVPHEHATPSES